MIGVGYVVQPSPTAMFCDLVDSTGASKLDAEEWRDLVRAYLDAASAAVTDMGGKVAKKLGDGLMALFGYPVAQENDAERAVRAALAIQRSLAELNRKNEGTGKPTLRYADRHRLGAGGGRCGGRDIRRRAQHRSAGADAGRTGCDRGDGASAASGGGTLRRRGAGALNSPERRSWSAPLPAR
jgi:class 3 adenylate cyclase